MHVARPVVQVEDLGCLGHRAEQGVVASGPFLLLVEADRRPFGMPAGRKHRTVEVERHPRELFGFQTVEHQVARHRSIAGHRLLVHRRERSADGCHVGQTFEAENPLGHRIVMVVVAIPQLAKAEKEMYDQPEDDVMGTIGCAPPQVSKARLKLPLDPKAGKQALKDDKPGERC